MHIILAGINVVLIRKCPKRSLSRWRDRIASERQQFYGTPVERLCQQPEALASFSRFIIPSLPAAGLLATRQTRPEAERGANPDLCYLA